MKIGYYPGCSLTGTAKEYDKSVRKTAEVLGIELIEIDDWNCCGATSAHITSHRLALSLSARNLLLASKQGLKEILAPCAACYSRLSLSAEELIKKPDAKKEIEELLGEEILEIPMIINLVQLYQRVGAEKMIEKKGTGNAKLKTACYYGCLLVRPSGLNSFDDSEEPQSMEKIVTICGAEPIDWNYKTECCGAAHSIARKDIVVDLSHKILTDAKTRKADIVITACPMCHTNLDMRQKDIKKKFDKHEKIPVLYLSEFVGLSMGLTKEELGIDLHFVPFESKTV